MSESVYFLWDPRNGDIRYVGKTNNPTARLWDHRHVSHRESYCDNWKREMAAEGVCCEMAILEKALSPEQANEREQWWIAHGRENHWPLTNLSDGGNGPSNRKPTGETRFRMGAGNRGKHITEKHKAAISASKIGVPRSGETKAKLRAANLGTKHAPTSEEQKAKLRASNLGKKHNNGAKISAAKLGQKYTEQARRNIGTAHLGSKLTEEHKANIAAGQRARWARRKNTAAASVEHNRDE